MYKNNNKNGSKIETRQKNTKKKTKTKKQTNKVKTNLAKITIYDMVGQAQGRIEWKGIYMLWQWKSVVLKPKEN